MTRARTLSIALIAAGCTGSGAGQPAPLPTAASPTEAGKQAPPALLAIDGTNVTRIEKSWEIELGGRGIAVAIDRGAARVAAATVGSSARLYDYWRGRSTGVSASCATILRGGLALRGGKMVVVCQDRIELYDSRSLKQDTAPEMAESRATAAHVSWPSIAVGHHDGVLRIYSLEGGPTVEMATTGASTDVKSVALPTDGSVVVAAWGQGSI